jgi:hypothetical protein
MAEVDPARMARWMRNAFAPAVEEISSEIQSPARASSRARRRPRLATADSPDKLEWLAERHRREHRLRPVVLEKLEREKMKKAIAAVLMAGVLGIALAAEAGGSFSKGSCTFNGKKLFGKIQVVTDFPDVKVQVVTAFPDVKVQKVNAFPDKCGKWQMVDAFPDTKVQFVDAFPDVKIQYVDALPGAN